MTKNWSVSCENIVSILFLAFANGMNVGFPIILVEPIRALQSYVCGFEQVKLYVSSNMPFVTIDATVVISMFYILHIMEVSHTCL